MGRRGTAAAGACFLPSRPILSALITGMNVEQQELLVLLSVLNLLCIANYVID